MFEAYYKVTFSKGEHGREDRITVETHTENRKVTKTFWLRDCYNNPILDALWTNAYNAHYDNYDVLVPSAYDNDEQVFFNENAKKL